MSFYLSNLYYNLIVLIKYKFLALFFYKIDSKILSKCLVNEKMTENDDFMLKGLDGNREMSVKRVNLTVLSEAEKNNVVLDDLEKVSFAEKKENPKVVKTDEPWRKLDVRLSDVINSFIANSERPVFLVRDDRLVYVNQAAVHLLNFQTDRELTGHKFFSLVAQEDWNVLAENIGEMLTNGRTIDVNLKTQGGVLRKVTFRAVYLPEIEHFSFILVGEHSKKVVKPMFNNLYDDVTGLPNFFLFEDRVHVAVSLENAKENAIDRKMIAVAAINIDNIEVFRKIHIEEMVLKKISGNLVLNLPKSATVALGLKYHFWIMLVNLNNNAEVNRELRWIIELLNEGVSDNLTRHELAFSIGASVFPALGHSSKKIIEQALSAVKIAQTEKTPLVFFNPKI